MLTYSTAGAGLARYRGTTFSAGNPWTGSCGSISTVANRAPKAAYRGKATRPATKAASQPRMNAKDLPFDPLEMIKQLKGWEGSELNQAAD